MNLQPDECYRLYLAIKSHFSSDYDYFKYNGKVRVGDFYKRKDRFSFRNLARQYDTEEIIDFFVSNCVYLPDKQFYVKNLLRDESKIIYEDYIYCKNNFEVVFSDDLDKLMKVEDFLKPKDGQLPYVVKALHSSIIRYETFIALDEILKFFPLYNNVLENDLIWPKIRKKCLNFKPFTWFEHSKLKVILIDKAKTISI